MTSLVVDSSVTIRWFIKEMDYQSQALDVFSRILANEFQLFAPDLIYAEIGNIVWKLRRFQNLKPENAQKAIESFSAVNMTVISNGALLKDAYTIAIQYNRSVYDCLYIALAQREKCSFVTADEKLVNAVGSQLPVIWLAKWS
jgi:predicted nucleic acid-binding protein